MSGDPLAPFFRWAPTIERYLGGNASGDLFEEPDTTVLCKVRLTAEIVITTDGRQVTTVATLQSKTATPKVPVGSKVALPAELGGGDGLVAVEGVHNSGIPGVPSYYEFKLERPSRTSG
ncbi:MAG: hypothetical protein INR72_18065 [Williamsia herbipolensis]|nr:hypothetical protein [Williamsia herbipolensis]